MTIAGVRRAAPCDSFALYARMTRWSAGLDRPCEGRTTSEQTTDTGGVGWRTHTRRQGGGPRDAARLTAARGDRVRRGRIGLGGGERRQGRGGREERLPAGRGDDRAEGRRRPRGHDRCAEGRRRQGQADRGERRGRQGPRGRGEDHRRRDRLEAFRPPGHPHPLHRPRGRQGRRRAQHDTGVQLHHADPEGHLHRQLHARRTARRSASGCRSRSTSPGASRTRRTSRRRITIKTEPAVEVRGHWFGNDRLDFRPEEYWKPGTKVTRHAEPGRRRGPRPASTASRPRRSTSRSAAARSPWSTPRPRR